MRSGLSVWRRGASEAGAFEELGHRAIPRAVNISLSAFVLHQPHNPPSHVTTLTVTQSIDPTTSSTSALPIFNLGLGAVMNSSRLLTSAAVVEYPVYHFARADVIPGLSDKYLSIIAPFAVYWVLSLLFSFIDALELPLFERYRIHEPQEVKTRNRVSINQVIWMVLFQQLLQTGLGLYWLEDDDERFGPFRNHQAELGQYKQLVLSAAASLLPTNSILALDKSGIADKVSNVAYWWLVPLAQFVFAA